MSSTMRTPNMAYPSITSIMVSSVSWALIVSTLAWLVLLICVYGMQGYSSEMEASKWLVFLTLKTQSFIALNHQSLNQAGMSVIQGMQNGLERLVFNIKALMSAYQIIDSDRYLNSISMMVGSCLQAFFVIMLRWIGLALFIPWFFLSSLVCVIDGLVIRDIRKFQSAMESTFFHHRMKRAGKSFFLFLIFLYLASPFYVSPWVYCIPMLMTAGLWIHVSCGSFKKYV